MGPFTQNVPLITFDILNVVIISLFIQCMLLYSRGEFKSSHIVLYIQSSFRRMNSEVCLFYKRVCFWAPFTDIFLFDLQKWQTFDSCHRRVFPAPNIFVVPHNKGLWIALIFRTLPAPQQEVLGILMSSYCLHSTLTLAAQTAEKVAHSGEGGAL